MKTKYTHTSSFFCFFFARRTRRGAAALRDARDALRDDDDDDASFDFDTTTHHTYYDRHHTRRRRRRRRLQSDKSIIKHHFSDHREPVETTTTTTRSRAPDRCLPPTCCDIGYQPITHHPITFIITPYQCRYHHRLLRSRPSACTAARARARNPISSMPPRPSARRSRRDPSASCTAAGASV